MNKKTITFINSLRLRIQKHKNETSTFLKYSKKQITYQNLTGLQQRFTIPNIIAQRLILNYL